MILIVDMSWKKDSLSCDEFVLPVKAIAESEGYDCEVVHFSEITHKIPEKSDRVILCGTALKDNGFLLHPEKFSWLKDFARPVLGICAGFEIISVVFGGKITESLEIGMTDIEADGEPLGKGTLQVYELHSKGITLPHSFTVLAKNKAGIQAIRKGNILGIQFHPEVRNEKIIRKWLS